MKRDTSCDWFHNFKRQDGAKSCGCKGNGGYVLYLRLYIFIASETAFMALKKKGIVTEWKQNLLHNLHM